MLYRHAAHHKTMVLVPGLLPPSYETWKVVNYWWQFFPVVSLLRLWCTTTAASTFSLLTWI